MDTRNTLAGPPVKDCAELYRFGLKKPGAYNLDITGARDPSIVKRFWCDSGWTTLLRREPSGGVNQFDKNMNQYRNGFGQAQNSHFVGLNKANVLTTSEAYHARLSMEDLDSNSVEQYYETFSVSDSSDGFRLTVDNFDETRNIYGVRGDLLYSNGAQ